MLGQTYATDNSNFGPIYHHHPHHNTMNNTTNYSSPYDKYKMSTSPHHAPNPYSGHYQGFYNHHQMVRQTGCIDYIPR